MIGLHWLDLLVIAAYFTVMIGIGFLARLRIRSERDYYLGGRRFGKILMVMFAFGAGTHADTAVGVAAKSYSIGLAGIWYQWQQLLTTPFYWLLAPLFRRARCTTTADFFERRYGTSFALLYTLDALFMNIGFTAVMLYGSGRLIEALVGQSISMPWIVGIMIVTSTIYGVAGGLVAAVWMDCMQGILTIVMSFLLVPFMWHAVGGRAGLQAHLANVTTALDLRVAGEIGVFWIIMTALNSLVSFVVQPHVMANAGAGKTESEGRIGLVGGMLIKRLCTIPWALVGVLGLALFAGTDVRGDHVFGHAVRTYLPAGLVGLMIACVLASVMDNCCIFMISSAALLTRNLYRRFVYSGGDERHMVWVARLTSVAFALLSVALAGTFHDMPAAMRYLWKTVPLIGIALFLGLWWRRANRYGAWASFLCALTAMVIGQFVLKLEGDARLPYLIALYLSAGIVGGIIVSLLTPREPERRLDEFYLTINTPVGQEDLLRRHGVQVEME